MPKEFDEIDDAATRRRKKKTYYAKLKKQEEEREKELAEKYRDRVCFHFISFSLIHFYSQSYLQWWSHAVFNVNDAIVD